MSTDTFPPGVKPFSERQRPNVICMFDVDGTLTPARRQASPEMLETLRKLRDITAVAFVGGSDLPKQQEQLEIKPENSVLNDFDYCFAENGLTAYKLGKQMKSESFIKYVGEDEYKKFINYVLRYLSELDVPVKRGTFVEFRNGMVNISPIGRNASNEERAEFEQFDKKSGVRAAMVKDLQAKFAHLNLTYSIGGMISFDVFPKGWDKTFALGRIKDDGYTEIHFFGDKCYPGGNDYEIYEDSRTIGHSVTTPEDTMKLLNDLFINPKK